ncbi:methyltransferase [Vibrio sp. CAIM 722]|uniref:tRNA1(Val) (adenine(37)-N6)-methyltransferase n=1 Tax=Vibrio eleionomae TaxID=2653505 RepID=A0A7X4LIL6_9VIBR|nr:methyltransferase [Vibrio eleionomae]MZI92608.1 methyltransferase [Vibrio eleionomae]
MNKKDFRFKQFTVSDFEQIGMPVSTDGVLIGSWAFQSAPDSLLDIGTGSGLLALMCAQRFNLTEITAIDIEPAANHTAQKNFIASPWNKRLKAVLGNILDMDFQIQFDAIICNPPYFTSGEQAHNKQRATARHTNTLDHNELIATLDRLTAPNAKAAFILPKVEGEVFINLAKHHGWQVSRLCSVKPSQKKTVHRLMFELIQTKNEIIPQLESLIIHEQQGYSAEFIALTHEFYLKM